jgi:hypothetical protein
MDVNPAVNASVTPVEVPAAREHVLSALPFLGTFLGPLHESGRQMDRHSSAARGSAEPPTKVGG